jgi:S-adenosylmethionine decarboxylase
VELGRHALADLYNCNNEILDDVEKIKEVIEISCKEANLNVVESIYHKFEPIGVSGVTILSESHITIHTWPEYNFASIDAFTCGTNMDPTLVCNILADKLKSTETNIKEYKRGSRHE